MEIKKTKNKVIPEICNRESQPYKKAKRLRSPTKTLGDDGESKTSWDDGVRITDIPDNASWERQSIKAFTLIELLVVVLIIGILAAVALPQYELAVAKSRIVSLFPLMKSIENAQQVYYLANNRYASDFSKLDIQMPAGAVEESATEVTYNNFRCVMGYNSGAYNSLYCRSLLYKVQIERYYNGYTMCWVIDNDPLGVKICKNFCHAATMSTTYCYF